MELPLSLNPGHHGTLVASPESLGWDVRVDVDGVTVLHSHVSDWHRVERLRARVEATHGAATNPSQPGGRDAGAGWDSSSDAQPTSSVNAVPGTDTARSLRRYSRLPRV